MGRKLKNIDFKVERKKHLPSLLPFPKSNSLSISFDEELMKIIVLKRGPRVVELGGSSVENKQPRYLVSIPCLKGKCHV